jgi:hypothetical protein
MEKEPLKLFDANCMLGIAPGDQGISFDTMKELETYRNRFGISEVLVYAAMAKYYNPIEGNAHLHTLIGSAENVHTCYVVLPSGTGEFPMGKTLNRLLLDNRASAVRMCPNTHDYEISLWNCSNLYEILEELRMPLFLDFDLQHWSDRVPWDAIYELCSHYPSLPVVLTRIGCGYNRNLFNLMDRCENLHFEISYFAANLGIETVARRFGADRMLFGTDAPIHTPSCPIGMLVYSDLSDDEKQMIAGGTLKNLIGGKKHG